MYFQLNHKLFQIPTIPIKMLKLLHLDYKSTKLRKKLHLQYQNFRKAQVKHYEIMQMVLRQNYMY